MQFTIIRLRAAANSATIHLLSFFPPPYSGGHKFCPYFCLARSTNDIVIQTLTFALRTAALSH
jgi:hypothetical protein